MLLEILKRTPPWVYLLFVALFAYGYFQSKPRIVPRARIAILPAVMIGLSLYGVLSTFGTSALALPGWLLGVGLALLLGQALWFSRDASYSPPTRSFAVPGSWLPLVLMMVIFFIRYIVAVLLALNPTLAGSALFAGGICLVYGFLTGVFLANAMWLWRIGNRQATS